MDSITNLIEPTERESTVPVVGEANASATSTGTLEQALAELERDADAALKSLGAALRETKRVKASAASGHLRDIRQALDGANRLSVLAADAVGDLRVSWRFDDQQHFDSGGFLREVVAAAQEQGVDIYESDQRLLCFPAIVQISSNDASVMIDKVKERRLRPSVLVPLLKAMQGRPPRFKAQPYLEALAKAYDLAAARSGLRAGAVVKLVDIYAVMTVLPGSSRDYTKQEFARDMYLLDHSAIVTTGDGRRMSLPASALTRGSGVLTTVTRSGQEKVYAGISFEATP